MKMLEEKKITKNGIADDKYFIIPFILKCKCPNCNTEIITDFGDEHIEYVSEKIKDDRVSVTLYCDECDGEFSLPIKINSISYTVNFAYDLSAIETIE